MDALAKKFWAEKFGDSLRTPTICQQEVEGEPVSVYVHGKKVVTGFRERLYDSVHGQKSAVALGGHWDIFRTSFDTY